LYDSFAVGDWLPGSDLSVLRIPLQARSAAANATAAAAAAASAAGYDSDQEVYAAAKAAEAGTEGQQYDSDDNLVVSCGSRGPFLGRLL
jgi:hypothetical protein